jgi:hypothetical protein
VSTSLVLALGAACGGAQRAPEVKVEPALKIIDAGAEPRQRLQYGLTAHVPERMEVTFKLRLNTSYANNNGFKTGHQSAELPTIKYVYRIEVTSVGADGTATVNAALDDIAALDEVAEPPVRKMVDREIQALNGWQGSWQLTPRGRLSDFSMTAPKASAKQRTYLSGLATAIQQTSVLFPDEPVGVGATWQVTSQHTISGVTWQRTTTFQLKALTDSTATIDAQYAMRAGPQALSVEPNVTTQLTSGTSSGNVELTVPLHGLVVTGTTHGTSELNMVMVNRHVQITSSMDSEELSTVRPLSDTGTTQSEAAP